MNKIAYACSAQGVTSNFRKGNYEPFIYAYENVQGVIPSVLHGLIIQYFPIPKYVARENSEIQSQTVNHIRDSAAMENAGKID